ncbi:hypothetical protein D9V37_16520 [Nocardioides mangrovicus]|uniref:Uncharacterized protein n=1 Tax=Nocardioides mangrovicus TaxID=2478913 RepID=A0A3L8NX45_9ACTN|nr:hypothetical protein [Nocardioides mangrovicus]RLV47745.1 hypothetical protein D9V37_16520 [Nocardioides mangrovicus]
MTCTYCLVEGLSAVPQAAVTAWEGTPVCGSCADHLAGERNRRTQEALAWTESSRLLRAVPADS